jgi:microcystin degradation protein MlrC
VLDEVAGAIWDLREELTVSKLSVPDAVAALRSALEQPTGALLGAQRGALGWPVLLADGGDSPSAGSTGDSTDLLAALLEIESDGAILATVADPVAARRLATMPVASEVRVELGGSLTRGMTGPVVVAGTTRWRGEGRYQSQYPAGPVDVGAVAVLQVNSCMLVVTERPAMMLDPALYHHVGLDPRHAAAVQVKSAGGFRALWAAVSERVIVVDTRGASDSQLVRLPFSRLPRPLWPFDADAHLGAR